MQDTDRERFEGLLKEFFAMVQVHFQPSMTAWWFEALKGYELRGVKSAMLALVSDPKRDRAAITPGSLLGYLPGLLGHPLPEIAWNHCPKSEGESGYVTSQIMGAMADCQDALDRGDYVAGRVAFIESYKARVRAAEAQKIRASFFYTDSNIGNREQCLAMKETKTIEALNNGWLTQEKARNVLEKICEELAKPSHLALERISAVVTMAKMPAVTTSPKITNKSAPTLEQGSVLMQTYGAIQEDITEKRAIEKKQAEEKERKLNERRKLLLEQAKAILNR